MKKIIAMALTLSFAMALVSCGGGSDEASSEGTSSITTSIPVINSSQVPSDPVSVVPPAPAVVDLALTATAFCDDNDNHFDQYEYAENLVNDGDIATAWQKNGSINAGDNGTWDKDTLYGEDTEIFIGLEWTEEQYIDTVVIYNSTSTAMETYENGGYKLEYFDGEKYVEVTNLADTRVSASLLEITLNFDAVSTTKIKLTLYKGIAASKHSPKIYTMCVYEAEEPAEETSSEAESTEDVVSE